MKPLHVIVAALAATSLFALAAESIGKLPEPWIVAGQSPKDYEAGIDYRVSVSGKGSKFLRCNQCDGKSWATVMQSVKAERYAGQRIRFQAQVRTNGISDWAGLWMGIDTKETPSAAFYNMSDKPIRGNTEWQIRSVTLDVPPNATTISFGAIGAGKGEVWIDDLKFDTVGKDTPVDVQTFTRRVISDKPSL
jgi:hypothetical protein